MSEDVPEGWTQVFQGPRVRADVLVAVLEIEGLHPVCQQFSPDTWWSGPVLEDVRIYVPESEAEQARTIVSSP
jgi:hypothetical protein